MSKKKCSSFEEMLMWTSYRYCIGRHTYVTSMAGEMAQHYYDKLSDDRLEFTAQDIRNQIYENLRILPFSLTIHRIYNSDEFNPISAIMGFIKKENINSVDEMADYCKVEYDSNNGTYSFDKKTKTIQSYFSIGDIDELLPWENLAACFDKKKHKIVVVEYNGEITEHRCFKSWKRSIVKIEDRPGYYRLSDFGWDDVWVDVDEFVKTGNTNRYIANEYIKEIKDII